MISAVEVLTNVEQRAKHPGLADCVPLYKAGRKKADRGDNSERRFYMAVAASVVGGLLLFGYCISCVKAKRETKKSVQTLFDTK